MIKQILILLILIVNTPTAHADRKVNIVFFGDTSSKEYDGVQLGFFEATLQGKFLNLHYKILKNPTDPELSKIKQLDIIVTDYKKSQLQLLIKKFPGLPILNLSDDADILRQECSDNVFHIIPSRAMLNDAKRLKTEEGILQAWQHNFRKYAALQLNNRFFNKYNEPMSDEAWFGWVSIKIIAELFIRKKNPDNFIFDLKNNINFDGQKGRKLSFRSDGQLRQPLFVVQNDKVVEEIPKFKNELYGGLDSIGVNRCVK